MRLNDAWALRRQREAYNAALPDEMAALVPSDAENWEPDMAYAVGDRRQYGGKLYKCLQPHTSQATWTPPDAPSLWAEVLPGQDGEIGEWVQPDSTNAYSKGDRVTHNGKTWESYVDGNVWEPGVYGWTEITEQED
jgi:chitodextrinase